MSEKISKKIESSQSLKEAFNKFIFEIKDWINVCMEELAEELPNGNHDQGTFTLGWNPYIIAEVDKKPVLYLKNLRDKIKNDFESKGKWKNGYWKMNEAHHGTEHFELFLTNLWKLDPGDGETIKQMVNVAEYMGNWSENVPDWFSWEKGLFYSFHFGTEGVDFKDNKFINPPDQFRCVNICIYAYQMTGESKYLNLANRHAELWADAIINHFQLPLKLSENGPVYSTSREANYDDNQLGLTSELASKVDRAENIIASSSIETLLKLWKITGNIKFRLAAEKILNISSTQVHDPDAACAVDLVRKYRQQTDDYRYDKLILNAVDNIEPYSFSEISIEDIGKRQEPNSKVSGHTLGIGRRRDKPYWYEDGHKAKNNPVLLALAAEIKNDKRLAIRALDIARTYFELAREIYPHGHRHGCGARSISAVIRGNGRENNTGVITAVLVPLMEKFLHIKV